MRAAVIGAGISGLAAAYRLKRAGAGVTLFESAERVGGNIATERRDGYLLEYGPNSLLAKNDLLDLVDDLDLTNEIARPKPEAKKRFIVRDGRMTELPAGVAGLLSTKAFSAAGRLRILREPFVGSRSPAGETVSEFFERRLGREIVEYAVDPFISGIYAGDPSRLSIREAFPRLHEFEARHGSIIRGAVFSKGEKRPKGSPRSFTFRNGVSTLTERLSERLGDTVRAGTAVTSVAANADRTYRVGTAGGGDDFDAVVISTPANAAASLTRPLDAELAAELAAVCYPPIAVVYAAFKKEQFGIEPNGFGVLVPSAERRRILGCLFTTSVFENRAPDGYHLLTVFIGGSRNASLCSLGEAELTDIAVGEAGSLLDISGGPAFAAVKKWERSIPQYNVGYERLYKGVDKFRALHPGIFFCSNFYRGISVGDCVRNAVSTSREVLGFFDGTVKR